MNKEMESENQQKVVVTRLTVNEMQVQPVRSLVEEVGGRVSSVSSKYMFFWEKKSFYMWVAIPKEVNERFLQLYFKIVPVTFWRAVKAEIKFFFHRITYIKYLGLLGVACLMFVLFQTCPPYHKKTNHSASNIYMVNRHTGKLEKIDSSVSYFNSITWYFGKDTVIDYK